MPLPSLEWVQRDFLLRAAAGRLNFVRNPNKLVYIFVLPLALFPLVVTHVPALYLLVRARAFPSIRQLSWAWLDVAAGCRKVGIKALRKGIKSTW